MSGIFCTSDLHFHHKLVAGLRGFATPEEHDEVILDNWNKVVRRKDDIVLIAGDVAMNWKGVEVKLARMNGRKILIEGNHDIMSSIHKDGWKHRAAWTGEGKFEAIITFMRRKTKHWEYLISHYPYSGEGGRDIPDRHTQYRLRDEGMWLAHGHTHSKDKITPLPQMSCFFCDGDADTCGDHTPRVIHQVHIGVDAWDLRPVREEDVTDLMNSLDRDRKAGNDELHV